MQRTCDIHATHLRHTRDALATYMQHTCDRGCMDNVSQLIGYACASTHGQDIAQQQTLLNQFGCQRIFEERVGGEYIYRLQLERLFDHLRAGDVIVVTSLDRLARSTTDLFNIAGKIKTMGAGLQSLAEPWVDTTLPAGQTTLTIFAGIADFERALTGERTSAGRAAAKARGVRFGPKPVLTPEQVSHARRLIAEDQRSVAEAASILDVHRSTLYRALSKP